MGMLSTARHADEMVEAVRFPIARQGVGYAFREVALRHGDFALCAVAAVAGPENLRIAVGGVADRPVARDYPMLADDALDDALNELAWDLGAGDDAHASAQYRRTLVRRVGRAVAAEAIACRT
jgi:2-furoyl-CoA dehydrogenase FAD binding subunit